jgi:hypothetical protein
MRCENATQKVLFNNAILPTLTSEGNYDVIPQNGNCSRKCNVSTLVFRNKARFQNATSLQNTLRERSTFR